MPATVKHDDDRLLYPWRYSGPGYDPKSDEWIHPWYSSILNGDRGDIYRSIDSQTGKVNIRYSTVLTDCNICYNMCNVRRYFLSDEPSETEL